MRAHRLLLLGSAAVVAASACSKRGPAGGPGVQGPPGAQPAVPRIESVSPPVGDTHNVVSILGTGFDATLGNDVVFFGGVQASVVSASATKLVVTPPTTIGSGFQPVVVAGTDGTVSDAVGFTVVDGGSLVGNQTAMPGVPGRAIALADGRIAIPDANAGVAVVDTAGVVRTLARGHGLIAPRHLALRPADGALVAFDTFAQAVFRVSTSTGDVTVLRANAPYLAGAWDTAGNLFAIVDGGTQVDEVAANGTLVSPYSTLPAGETAVDIAAIGSTVYLAMGGTVAEIGQLPATAGTPPTVLAVAGVTSVHSLSASGATLIAGGTFVATNSQEGVIQVGNLGGVPTVTALTNDAAGAGRYGRVDAAVLVAQSGALLISDGITGAVETLLGSTLTVRAGSVASPTSSLRLAGATFVSAFHGQYEPGWISRVADDGTVSLLAQGDFAELAAGDDATTLTAVRPVDADVANVTLATGAVASRFDASAITAPSALARDLNGNFYVSSPTATSIAKFDSAGTLVSPTWSSAAAVASLYDFQAYLFASRPSNPDVVQVSVTDGSVKPFIAPSEGVTPATVWHDTDPASDLFFVADPTAGMLWEADDTGFVKPFYALAEVGTSVTQREDGMVIVLDDAGLELVAP